MWIGSGINMINRLKIYILMHIYNKFYFRDTLHTSVKTYLRFYLFVFFISINFNILANNQIELKSPDGALIFNLYSVNSSLAYDIKFKEKIVIEQSLLGIQTTTCELGRNIVLGKANLYKIDETYHWRGVHSIATNLCNGAKISITDNNNTWIFEVNVFNDGVAFRYIFDTQNNDTITNDNSTFQLPSGSVVWSQNNIKNYEGTYKKQLVDSIREGEMAGPPIVIQLKDNDGYISITEAGLYNFAGISLKANGKRGYQARLAAKVVIDGKVQTPWRVIMVTSDLNSLVNCDMVHNLSPAPNSLLFPKGFDTEWIKPGRCLWSWLADKRDITPANMKEFSKMASQLGFEYNLVDEGWGYWKEEGKDNWDLLRELVDYSKTLGVGIWVWKAYPDRKGIEGIKDSVKRREFFSKCKAVGVVGLKIDFFDSESQEIIDFYQNALKDAAKYHLMINFHGSNKPTGESRTYPNEMTREAVRGLENRPPWALHNTILPFTRYLAGHADFTPIHFGKRIGETSWAHQIASAVVFTSPLLVYGADPKSMLDNPCLEIIKNIPTIWDETIVLPPSAIGELAIMARRKGDMWFIAALNGQTARQVTINLSFLGKGKYIASIVHDDKDEQQTAINEKMEVSNKQSISIDLNIAGGFVAQILKQK
jgi:alpha-glucosidase